MFPCAEGRGRVFLGSGGGRRGQLRQRLRRPAQAGSHAPRQGRQVDAAPARAAETRSRTRGASGSRAQLAHSALCSRVPSPAAGTRNDSRISADGTVSADRSIERLGTTVSERSRAGCFHAAVTHLIAGPMDNIVPESHYSAAVDIGNRTM